MLIAKKRSYNSQARKRQSQETKERVIQSAKKLFESEGFEHVTIEKIATTAKVSMPTVYALFGSKVGILRSLMDIVVPPSRFEDLVRHVVEENNPAKRLALSATIARQIYDEEKEQLKLLQGASILDAELKKLEHDREKRRYKRQEKSLQVLEGMGALASNLTFEQARDVLWALTGRDLYRLLVIERGWHSDEYEQWLAHFLKKVLLK